MYLLHSFESPLPWAKCPTHLYDNFTYSYEPECVVSSPTQYYWYRSTLQSSQSVNDFVAVNYPVAIALMVAWFLVYICMVQGITSSGKIVYITAIFPYVVLIIFFFRGITLHGAFAGVARFFTPRWELLLDPVVWLEAGTQIFFSLGLAFGGLIAFSSYNPANNNCYRDAILVSLTNCGTSMFAGIVVFSIIGFKATSTYEKCLSDRNASIMANITTNLPVCDLERELDNVSKNNLPIFWRNLFINNCIRQIECIRNWFGIHNLHRSYQSISWSSILGSSFLPNVIHTWNRLTVWHAWRSCHFSCWHETVPKFTKGHDHRSMFLKLENYHHHNINLSDLAFLDSMHIMRYHINCIRSWSWQLCISADGQFCWKLLSLDYCVLWMHCNSICLWNQTVIGFQLWGCHLFYLKNSKS